MGVACLLCCSLSLSLSLTHTHTHTFPHISIMWGGIDKVGDCVYYLGSLAVIIKEFLHLSHSWFSGFP